MTRYFALAVAAILAAAMPAAAQSAFQPGQKVKSAHNPAHACTTMKMLIKYLLANRFCVELSDKQDCKVGKDLESRGICAPGYKSYVVISIKGASSLMQISPVEDKSKTYWAQQTAFEPVK